MVASHNRKPESVLNAPGITTVHLSEFTGLNRRQRRKSGIKLKAMVDNGVWKYPSSYLINKQRRT